jgi:copper oxidase (laccase) domain-containing protein
VPVYLYDPARRVIGLLHAGWRGTAGNIVQFGLSRMRQAFKSDPADVQLYLGPSIEKGCYPVGRGVYRQFGRWCDLEIPMSPEVRLDLKDVIRSQAQEAGVGKENVFCSGYCTRCSTDLFHSHRGSGGRCGRMIAFIGLSKQIFS